MATVTKYAWKGKAFRAEPEKVYKEIQTLGKEYTPHQILELARNENTELHKCFEWDDAIASELWRLHTARQICCSLSVVVETEERQLVPCRLIQHDDSKEAYAPVVFTVRNEDEYSRLLKQANAELQAFKVRYKSIVELQEIIEDIDKFIN